MESAAHHPGRTSEVPRLCMADLTASVGLSPGNTPTRSERRCAQRREQAEKDGPRGDSFVYRMLTRPWSVFCPATLIGSVPALNEPPPPPAPRFAPGLPWPPPPPL